jgi:hypothetical protein
MYGISNVIRRHRKSRGHSGVDAGANQLKHLYGPPSTLSVAESVFIVEPV